jgi:hypothetical protein
LRPREFVIGGYRPGPNGVDALLVGYHEGKQLRFAGYRRLATLPLPPDGRRRFLRISHSFCELSHPISWAFELHVI